MEGRRFVASILELYDDQKWIDNLLLNILPKAEAIIMLRETSSSYYEKPLSSEKAPLCYA